MSRFQPMLVNSSDSVVRRAVYMRHWRRQYRVEVAALPQSDDWNIVSIKDIEDNHWLMEHEPMFHEVELEFSTRFGSPKEMRKLVQRNYYDNRAKPKAYSGI